MGLDVVAALRAELAAQGLQATVPAIMNDTVATLVGCSGAGWLGCSCLAGCLPMSSVHAARCWPTSPLMLPLAFTGACLPPPCLRYRLRCGTASQTRSWESSWAQVGSQLLLQQLLLPPVLTCWPAVAVAGMSCTSADTSALRGRSPIHMCLLCACSVPALCCPLPGTNCAYLERVAAISKLPPGFAARTGSMIVNSEWADFRSRLLPSCPEDVWLDCSSPHPGRGLLEKQMSGLYLGEVARRCLLRWVRCWRRRFKPVGARSPEGGSEAGKAGHPGELLAATLLFDQSCVAGHVCVQAGGAGAAVWRGGACAADPPLRLHHRPPGGD